MKEKFGVITVQMGNEKMVVAEGNDTELTGMLSKIKEEMDESAEIKYIDKEEYEARKENIIELNKLLNQK